MPFALFAFILALTAFVPTGRTMSIKEEFEVHPELELHVVAGENLVSSPVAIAFDAVSLRGRVRRGIAAGQFFAQRRRPHGQACGRLRVGGAIGRKFLGEQGTAAERC